MLRARPAAAGRCVVAAEDLDVRVAEAVDRLALVADAEEVVAREQLQQLVLERVGVLELVHEHVREALAVARAQRPVGAQQVAREQLEVLEVEPRAAALGGLVALAEQRQQVAQQRVVEELAVGEAELAVGRQRLLVGDADVARRAPWPSP